MSCDRVQKEISALLDRRLRAGERERTLAHLKSCRECRERLESMAYLRTEMAQLAKPAIPVDLQQRLRVLASHERVRQLARVSIAARMKNWAERVQLWFDNLVRPVAMPVAGGVASALLLFSALMPSLSFAHNSPDELLFTHPVGLLVEQVGSVVKPIGVGNFRIEPANAAIPADANVVLLTIDATGRVSDFHVTHGKLTQDLQNIIMFSQFMPGTMLGLPIVDKVKVVQVPSRAGRA